MLFDFPAFIEELREKEDKKEIVEKYEKYFWKLVIGSFSSDYELKQDDKDEKWELYIAVKSWDQSIVKTVSELWSFQILRLYEIYIEEQMNLQILMNEEEEGGEKEALLSERQVRLKKWNAVLDTLNRSQEAEAAKKEQEASLWDLMWKL